MTVTYTAKIATVKFKTLWKLLRRWRGSVYKHLWKDGLLFVTLYFTISLIYRFALPPTQKTYFEKLVLYCKKESNNIPVAFVLGFYVTIVVNRWWAQVNDSMPWPDNLAITITALVHGNDDRGRLMRRTLMRYINLSWIVSLCSISTIAKKRFPTLEHLVEIGLMTRNEQEIFDNIRTGSNKYYVPLVWATTLISRARKEDRIHTDYAKVYLLQMIGTFRGQLGTLFNYDWLSVPLVYTQVVTIAVQAYFLANVIGAQFLEQNDAHPDRDIDIYIPVFTLLQFLFYMGWLKVAESLINPFGEDDDDFDTNWVIDRNIQVSYLIVDDMHSEHPELIKDAYWDSMDFILPYTAAAEQFKMDPYLGSTNEIELKEEELMFLPTVLEEDENGARLPVTSKTAVEQRKSAENSNTNIVRSSLQRLLQGIKRTTNQKSSGTSPAKTASPPAATVSVRDAAARSVASAKSVETAAAILYDNYATVKEYPEDAPHTAYYNISKDPGAYRGPVHQHNTAVDIRSHTRLNQQQDKRESPTIDYRLPSSSSSTAENSTNKQRPRKHSKQQTSNQTNNASRSGCHNAHSNNKETLSRQIEHVNDRNKIFSELRQCKIILDKKIKTAASTIQEQVVTQITPAETWADSRPLTHTIHHEVQPDVKRTHSSRRVDFRCEDRQGRNVAMQDRVGILQYNTLLSNRVSRHHTTGSVIRGINIQRRDSGQTQRTVAVRSRRLSDNEKLEYLEREIAEAEQLLEDINRAEREIKNKHRRGQQQ